MIKIDANIAEFTGIFLGDGFTNKYTSCITEFVGHKDKEWNYFNSTIIPMVRCFSNANPKLAIRGNTLRLRFNSKQLYEFISKELKLQSGRKSHKIEIPNFILNNRKLYASFLRGVFDTDGSIVWDKRKLYLSPYPRLSITTISKKFALQIIGLLQNIGFNPRFYTRKIKEDYCSYNIDIYGFQQFNKWIKLIGFSNNKHINRLMPQ